MGTRCSIAVKHNGIITSAMIMCDGGPQYMSKRLVSEFNTYESVLKLCSLICLTTLDDRSDLYLGEEPIIHNSIEEWKKEHKYSECEYFYLLDAFGFWNVVLPDGTLCKIDDYLDQKPKKPELKVINFNNAKEKLKEKLNEQLIPEQFNFFVEDVQSNEIAEFVICGVTHTGNIKVYVSVSDFISAVGLFEIGKFQISDNDVW
jgi:hypothetical protein